MGLDDRDWRAREPVDAAPAPKQSASAQDGSWEKAKQVREASTPAEPKPQAAAAAPQPANEQVGLAKIDLFLPVHVSRSCVQR